MPTEDAAPAHRGPIVVIESEPPIAELQERYLAREGFDVHVSADAAGGLAAVRGLRPAAIVLEAGCPDIDPLATCRDLRSGGDRTPILFLIARGDAAGWLSDVRSASDDVLGKPFAPRELVAKVKDLLRTGTRPPEPVLGTGRLQVDTVRRTVVVDDADVHLTATEFQLLEFLLRHPGQVFSRNRLLSEIWGYTALGSRTVDVHIAQLRAKLGGASPIRTVRGVGYAAAI